MQEVGWGGEKIIGTQIFILEVWGGLFYTASEEALLITRCSQSILHPLLPCWVQKVVLKELKLVFSMPDLSPLQCCRCLFSQKLIADAGDEMRHLPARGMSGALSISSLRSACFICLLPMESFASGSQRWKESVLFSSLCTKAQILLFLLTAPWSIGQF